MDPRRPRVRHAAGPAASTPGPPSPCSASWPGSAGREWVPAGFGDWWVIGLGRDVRDRVRRRQGAVARLGVGRRVDGRPARRSARSWPGSSPSTAAGSTRPCSRPSAAARPWPRTASRPASGAAVNTSPEPFRNSRVSTGEDVSVVAVVLLARGAPVDRARRHRGRPAARPSRWSSCCGALVRRRARTPWDEGLTVARILVVGSGFAGLSAAARLAKLRHEVTVLEREHEPGGLLLGMHDRRRPLGRRARQRDAPGGLP